MLIYAPFEEGRGAGLQAKVDSMIYMQENGVSSSAAFKSLGFNVDGRDYGYAVAILIHLEVRSIRCLTNNPRKVVALQDAGINVENRIELVEKDRRDLHNFFVDKVLMQGHQINLDETATEEESPRG